MAKFDSSFFLCKIDHAFDREVLLLNYNLWIRPTPLSVLWDAFTHGDSAWRIVYVPTNGNARFQTCNTERLCDYLEITESESFLEGEYELERVSIWRHLIPWVWQAIVHGTVWPWR